MNNNKQLYQEAYLRAYCQSDISDKSDNRSSFLQLLILIFLQIVFVIVLNFLLLNNNNNETKIALNKYNNFSDEIIYKNVFKNDTLDFIIKKDSNQLLFQDNYSTKKFEEVTPPQDLIPLKKINFSNNISEKKKKFIKTVLPLIVEENRKIIFLRKRLINLRNYLNQNKTLNQKDQNFISNLAIKYSVAKINRHKIDMIDDLLISIDIIPNSIALAQAANESGWGSSRFATEFNALFGEYTYNNKVGIIPSQREKGKKHLIKYFSSLDKSVESYFNNINSNFAYSKFRKLRKILRDQNTSFNINLLVNKLDGYAEDIEYVDNIVSIINYNKLTQYDNIISLLTES